MISKRALCSSRISTLYSVIMVTWCRGVEVSSCVDLHEVGRHPAVVVFFLLTDVDRVDISYSFSTILHSICHNMLEMRVLWFTNGVY